MTEFNDEIEFGTIPEADRSLATEALEAIRDGDTDNALTKLNQLRLRRPNDPKVIHNCLVASSESPSTLLVKLEELANSPSFDDVEYCVVILNLALLHFRQQRYHQTQELLERLVVLVEPLGEALYRDTLFLYMETCLMLNYPEKVPKLIAILEGLLFGRAATPKSGNSSPQESRDKCETNVEWKPIVNQYRVRCLLALRSLKACKREVKNLNGEDKDRDDEDIFVTSVFVRAQLEQQRDSGRKAIKILNTLHGKSTMANRHLATIYYNNMAAIHFKAGKPNLATMYVCHSLEEYERQVRSGQGHQVHLFFNLLYNQAVCKLFNGSARSAFEDLTGCAQLIGNNPYVWMRLAECCLLIHNETFTEKSKMDTHVGEGFHRRILLSSVQCNQTDLRTEADQMQPTLSVAIRALKICLASIADFESFTAVEIPGDNNAPCVSALHELRLLNNSALCALAYASLCLGDFVAAQEACEVLLIQEELSPAQRVLAHLYCAEALLMQDQLSEAVEHLSLDNVEELVSLNGDLNASAWGARGNVEWLPSNKQRCKLLFHYNLAVAFVFREELHKAEQALRPALEAADNSNQPLDDHVLGLSIYLNLQQGKLQQAKQLICKYLPIVTCN